MSKFIFSLILVFCFTNLEARAQQNPPPDESRSSAEKTPAEDKNKKFAENNEKIARALKEGGNAYQEKKYRLAAEKFDEGYKLDPDFPGTAPVFLTNKALALRMLGTEKYIDAVNRNINPAAEANQYFLDSVNALTIAETILDGAPTPADESQKKVAEQNKLNVISGLMESYKLLVMTDETKINDAVKAFEDYIKLEPDDLRKQKAQNALTELKTKFKITD